MKNKTWLIGPEDQDERLDIYLTFEMPERSRSTIQKMIKAKHIKVNGKVATVHRFLKAGDKIEWNGEEAKRREVVRKDVVHAPLPAIEDLIVEETPDWIVLDKPSGLLVHSDSEVSGGTLVDLLVAHYPPIAKVGEDPERPGIMSRLDREVSGLIVVAKTQAAFESLKQQFAGRGVSKKYLTLCHGTLPDEEGDIKFRIARSTTQPRMAARPANETEGKAAWTHYKVKERFIGATLAELEILSGRTHQIRAHLHAMGSPVIGDMLYKIKNTERNVKAPRLMLQSVSLEFNDPASGERKHFELAPVPEFEQMIEEFRHS